VTRQRVGVSFANEWDAQMPARIVVAHDDPEFVEDTVTALWDAGYEVVSFADSMSALDALEAAQHVEMLITRVLRVGSEQTWVFIECV
jgi:DNA-binding NtrC family response regulator